MALTGSSLKLPYPAATQAPDVPGDIYALANALDNKLYFDPALGNYLDFNYANSTFDNTSGVNAVIAFGAVRVVQFSFYRATGWDTVSPPATMRVGHRPVGKVWTGVSVGDGTTNVSGDASIDASGAILVPNFVPDVASDSRYNSVRGTFVYWANS